MVRVLVVESPLAKLIVYDAGAISISDGGTVTVTGISSVSCIESLLVIWISA